MKNETKHTPGPWRIKGKYIWQDGGRCTMAGAVCVVTDHTHPQAQADARLIASAPDLLAACEDVYRERAEDYSASRHIAVGLRLEAAIAKAVRS